MKKYLLYGTITKKVRKCACTAENVVEHFEKKFIEKPKDAERRVRETIDRLKDNNGDIMGISFSLVEIKPVSVFNGYHKSGVGLKVIRTKDDIWIED